ncbi:hypothetical protein [Methylophilus luteus]|uniref:Uncharacterized protein n=1 Tax=Methylophilus luteus TaxID=640108 RepID=A0ABW3F3W9_9PROT
MVTFSLGKQRKVTRLEAKEKAEAERKTSKEIPIRVSQEMQSLLNIRIKLMPLTTHAVIPICCSEHPPLSYSNNLPLKNAAFVVRYNSFFYSSFL